MISVAIDCRTFRIPINLQDCTVVKLDLITPLNYIHCYRAFFIMCCEPSGYREEEINGECSICGEATVDGDAYEQCGYSPIECEECGWAPCDQSC